jgi:hypothetical protein
MNENELANTCALCQLMPLSHKASTSATSADLPATRAMSACLSVMQFQTTPKLLPRRLCAEVHSLAIHY